MKQHNKKYKLRDSVKNVHVEERIIPDECTNKNCGTQIPKYIIIHEVSLGLGKTPKEYDMDHYEKKIIEMGLNGRTIGYHYLVSDTKIYHFIPDTNCTSHTGTDFNNYSIGIERLVNEDVYFPDALHNQAKLAATLMVKWNIPITNVISHKTARILTNTEPKSCPNRMLAGQYGGFDLFYKEIKKCLHNKDLFYEIIIEQYLPQHNIDETIQKLKKGL